MRTTEIMTISLPPELLRQFEEVRKRESRTRSELVREALRVYFERVTPRFNPQQPSLQPFAEAELPSGEEIRYP